MKYHIFYRISPSSYRMIITSESDRYYYSHAVDTKEEVEKLLSDPYLENTKIRVIKGDELEYEEQYETITHVETKLKARKIII